MFIVQDFRKSLSIVTPYFVFPVFLRYGSATRHFAQLSDLTQKISFCLILFSAGWKNFEISLILWLLSRDPGGYVCWSVQIWYLKFLDFFVWKLFLSWTRIFLQFSVYLKISVLLQLALNSHYSLHIKMKISQKYHLFSGRLIIRKIAGPLLLRFFYKLLGAPCRIISA